MRWLAVALVACASGTASEPQREPRTAPRAIVGHVGVHQFAAGSHAWANFGAPVGLADYSGDDPYGVEPGAARTVGSCALHVLTALDPPARVWRDGGEVEVLGGATPLRMWFASDGYATEPRAGNARLFRGGEQLTIRGRDFATTVAAPTIPELIAPVELHAPFAVRWRSEASPTMVIVLTASPRDGRPSAYIRCATADVGALTFAPELVNALPSAPRDLRLDVERYEERLARLGDDAVLVRVAHTAWLRSVE
jgi:hypothetical protein